MRRILDRLLGRVNAQASVESPAAIDVPGRLAALHRPARRAALGGLRPDRDDRAQSWWGGNFLGTPGEGVPVCPASGRAMAPVLQLRLDGMEDLPQALAGTALISFWLDLDSDDWWRAEAGRVFALRRYASLEELVPTGPGYREGPLPCFLLQWRPAYDDPPVWEDAGLSLPGGAASQHILDAFDTAPSQQRKWAKAEGHPIKLGGWPDWIQGSQTPGAGCFLFQIDSTDKGGLALGDGGTLYVFDTPDGPVIRGDCY